MPTPISTTEAEGGVVARIDLDALRHNLSVVRRSAPGRRVMAVIKSQAYGHGAAEVARALEGRVEALAVARVDEAVALRERGVRTPLVVLEGPLFADDVARARRHALELVVHDAHQLPLLEQTASSGDPLACWIKFDTGMNRLGFDPADAPEVLRRLRALEGVRPAGLMSHLANADDRDDPFTETQLRRLRAILPESGLPRSIANSAGILGWPESHADWVRPGLMLYGASPLAGVSPDALDLRPVMTLEAPLIARRTVAAGARVGYGGTWTAPRRLPLGVVGIGYGDGYPRGVEGGPQVRLRGRAVPVVGRVSMDMLTVDLSACPDARVGDRVRLWGPDLPVDRVAGWAGTIPYTLLCGVTERVPRRVLED